MTKTSELALSLKAIRETVYALSAMHSYMSPVGRPMPPILSPDHKEGIDRLIKHSATALSTEYPGRIMTGRAESDTISLTAGLQQGSDATSVRHTIEHILVARTMWECYTGVDNETADRYKAMYTEGTESLKRALATMKPKLKLRPHSY